MIRPALIAAILLAPLAARAGTAPCWIDQGAVVVPAMVAGVAGDYILDTGTARTQLFYDRALGEGYTDVELTVEVRVAGLRLAAQSVAVANLDSRTRTFPTPIAGVIGADILGSRVLDLQASPCRVGIYRSGRAPAFGAGQVRRLRRTADGPLALAAVSDGPTALAGAFLLATGSGWPVSFNPAVAGVTGSGGPARLRALSFAGELFENPLARLSPDISPAALGSLGAPVLGRWRLRIDGARDRLILAAP